MHYVCIENNQVISVLSYQPNVPSSVTVVEVTDEQHSQIMAQTHYFDVTSSGILPVSQDVITQKHTAVANGQEREFLNNTDWKILRHLRQKALNIATSLSDTEYIQLEQQREAAAARVVSQQ
jgi:hypothetical protein